MQIDIISPVD